MMMLSMSINFISGNTFEELEFMETLIFMNHNAFDDHKLIRHMITCTEAKKKLNQAYHRADSNVPLKIEP